MFTRNEDADAGQSDRAARNSDATPGLLVVDDDQGVRLYLEHVLSREGYRMFPASNLADAVALFRLEARDVRAALLDVSMPGGDGCDVLLGLRALRPGLPAVFMSGELDAGLTGSLADRLRRAGADGLIAKPIRLAVLLAALATALGDQEPGVAGRVFPIGAGAGPLVPTPVLLAAAPRGVPDPTPWPGHPA